MTTKFLLLLLQLTIVVMATSQGQSRQQADSMLIELRKSKPSIHRGDILLGLAQFHIFKPGEDPVDFDSARVFIKQAEVLNLTLRSPEVAGYLLLTESYMEREKGQREEAKKMTEQAINVLERSRNKNYLGKAYYELSQYYDWTQGREHCLKMIALVEKAVAAFHEAGNLERKAFSLTMLGDLQSLVGNYPQAIDALKQALAAYEAIHYTEIQSVYALLGRIYTAESDHRRALHYQLLALKTAQAEQDSSMQLCAINNNLGNLYNSLKQHELSITYYKAALEIAKKHDDSYAIIPMMASITAAYNGLGQHKEAIEFLQSVPKKFLRPKNDEVRSIMYIPYLRAYTGTNELDKAKPYCDWLLKLLDNKEISNDTKSTVYRTIASYYIKAKNYPAAREQMLKNDSIVGKLGAFRISLGLAVWHKLDLLQGRFRDAYFHLHEYKKINDSIFNATKAKQLQQLEVEYETAKKQDSIKLKDQDILLLTQKNELQHANLRQVRFSRNVTIAVVLMTFIIIAQLYRQYRHKQKTNQTITQKNDQLQHLLTEKEWLLKEIHHRVKNNLQIVMSLLNSQSAYIDNEPALTAIHDSQHRVHAMSLIHQKLYNADNLSSIETSSYIRELVSYLADSFDTGQRLHFELNIAPLDMDVSQAVPLGLILNEAITNAIKYAFPNKQSGVISISLTNTYSSQYLLVIADNGIGIPLHQTNRRPGSLGMSLMEGLSEDMDGSFSIENNNGTVIKILFRHEAGVKRPGIARNSFVSNS